MKKFYRSPLLFCLMMITVFSWQAYATDPLIPLTDTSCVLNLDEFAAGTIVLEQYSGAGIHVSATAYGGFPDLPIIFNTNLVGTPDPDIELGIGNVLILPEDTADSNNDGLVDVPNKSSAGGIFNFNFDEDFVIYSVVLLDVDNAPLPLPLVTTFDSSGNILSTVSGVNAGNGSIQSVQINTAGVRSMTIDFPGSGAITSLIVGCGSTPLSLALDSDTISCFGDTNGELCVLADGGVPPYSYLWDANAGSQTTNCATGLSAGTYMITVTDGFGETASATASVHQPTEIIVSLDTASLLCADDSSASLNATATGGNPPYAFAWSQNTGGQTSATAINLGAGIYSVTVTDANGCDVVATTIVSAPEPFVASLVGIDATCPGKCDGQLTLSALGGTPPYTYVSNGGLTGIFTTPVSAGKICAGTYSVMVTDANGCQSMATSTIEEPDTVKGIFAVTPATCNGSCDGQVTMEITGGNGSWGYKLADGQTFLYNGPVTASNLCAGTYLVTVSDTNLCFTRTSVTVPQPDVLEVLISGTHNVCDGDCTGTATAVASGGNGGYTFSWSDGQTTATAIGLCAGQYAVTVTDSLGCIGSNIITITEGSELVVDVTASPDTICPFETVQLSANISGGNPDYTYNWSASGGTIDSPATANPTYMMGMPGSYDIILTVVDSNGCSGSDTIQLIVEGCGSIGDYVWCDDNGDGIQDSTEAPIAGVVIELIQNGVVIGTMTTDANGAYDFTNLPPGMYTVNVVDTTVPDGKQLTTGNDPLMVNLGPGEDFNDADFGYQYTGSIGDYVWCDDNGDGIQDSTEAPIAGVVIELIQNGVVIGTMTTDANGAYDFTNLPPGMYTVNVVDTTVPDGKQLTTGNDPLMVNLGPGEDFNDADFGYQYTGSIGDYVWCDDNGDGIQDSTEAPIAGVVIELIQNGVVIGTMTTDANGAYDFTNLPPGMYTVNVVDTTVPDGKQLTTGNDPLMVNLGPGEDFNDADFGYQYTGSIGDYVWCDDNGDGIQDSTEAPIAGVVIELIQNGVVIGTMTTDANGAYDFTNLPPGMYTVNVVDTTVPDGKQLTTGNDPLMVNLGPGEDFNDADFGYNCIPPVLSTVSVAVSCNGFNDGAIDLTLTGGSGTIFTFAWSSGDTTEDLSGLGAGTYSVTVTDQNGCFSIATDSISEPPVLIVSTTGTNVTCNGFCNGTATANPSGGNGGYTFSWSDGQTTQTATGLCAGPYAVTVSDANGCIAVDSIMITEFEPLDLAVSSTTMPACFGFADGQATVIAQGGAGGYTYQWDDSMSQTTATATGLMAGIYNVTVADSNGCNATIVVELDQPKQFTVNVLSGNATCDTICDGVAVSSTLGGTGNMNTYIWSDGQTSAIATGLCPGMYSVTATDQTGCSATASVIVGSNCKTGSAGRTANPAIEAIPEKSVIKVYPNPASVRSRIDFTSSVDDRLNIELFDITGQQVKVIFSGQVETGSKMSVEMNIVDVPDGVYLVRFSGAEGLLDVKRLVIAK